MLFTFANSPILPLVGSALTKLAPDDATILVAACIVLPQLVVAAPRGAGSDLRTLDLPAH